MGNRVETAPEEPISKDKCCHYWIIETSSGPTSKGVCKFCGAEKEFGNSLPDLLWEDDTSDVSDVSQLPKHLGLPDVEPEWEQGDS